MRICLLSYRCYRYSGGQGIYVRYLSRSLRELGHDVEVISGPPYPELDDGVKLIKLPSLDLYSLPESQRFFINHRKLSSLPDLTEWLGACGGFFTEPLTFGMRAYDFLRNNDKYKKYDVIHDNQSLSYSILKIKRLGIPVVTTIHHPITIDRDLAIKAAKSSWQKMGIRRWYSFANMQIKIAKKLSHFITGSQNSYRHIIDIFKLPKDSLRVIYDGVDSSVFTQVPEVGRSENRLLVINSGDTPLKGLKYLLEAVAALRSERKIELMIVGKPMKNGYTQGLADCLGIGDCVTHAGQIDTAELVRQYSMATMVVVPSVYEGFGLPAAEAMCCSTPVISTTAGALPEIVGDAGILVPPADTGALVEAIAGLLDNPDRRRRLAEMGHRRAVQMFNWKNTAKHTANVYKEAIEYQYSFAAR
ncbi:MAG: glycosyltransferase family 4 protein [Dehalococcoidia bacterium]|nr:glycosyltransferase family 4 protein [Dehalococcoidia bacterium]